jgi:hypothetical protein
MTHRLSIFTRVRGMDEPETDTQNMLLRNQGFVRQKLTFPILPTCSDLYGVVINMTT